jgi:hypothetical protein
MTSSPKGRRFIACAAPAILLVGAVACGSSNPGPASDAPVLSGPYETTDEGPIALMDFSSGTYRLARTNPCTTDGPQACSEQGTFVLSQALDTLALKNGQTGTTTTLPFHVLDSAATNPQALRVLGNSLVGDGGSLLVKSVTSLINSFLVNGAQHFQSPRGQGPASGSAPYCVVAGCGYPLGCSCDIGNQYLAVGAACSCQAFSSPGTAMQSLPPSAQYCVARGCGNSHGCSCDISNQYLPVGASCSCQAFSSPGTAMQSLPPSVQYCVAPGCGNAQGCSCDISNQYLPVGASCACNDFSTPGKATQTLPPSAQYCVAPGCGSPLGCSCNIGNQYLPVGASCSCQAFSTPGVTTDTPP